MTSRRDFFSGLFRKPNGPNLVLDGGNPPDDPTYTWRYPLVSVGFRRMPPQEIRNDLHKLSSAAGRVFTPPVIDGKAAMTTFAIVSLRTEVNVIPPYPGVRPDHLLNNFLDLRSIYSDATFGAFECRNYPQEYEPRCPWWGFHLRPPMVPSRAEHRNAVEFFEFDKLQRRGITGGSGTWLNNLCDELYDARHKYEDELKESLSQAGDPNGQRLRAMYGSTLPFFDPTERGDYKSWRSWAQGRDAVGHTLRYIAEIKAIRYWYDEVHRQTKHPPGTPVDRAPILTFIGTWVGSVDTSTDWEFLYRSPLPLYVVFTIPFICPLRRLRVTGELHGDEAYRVGAFPRNFPAAVSRCFPPDPHQDHNEVGVNRGDPFTQAARKQHDECRPEECEPWPELRDIKVPHEYQTAETTAWNRPFYTYPFLDGAIIRYAPSELEPSSAPPGERERLQNELQSWWEAVSRDMVYRRPIAMKDSPPTDLLPPHPLAYFVSISGNEAQHFVEDATPGGVFRWATKISKRQWKRDKADIYDDEEQYPHIYDFLGARVPAVLHTQFSWPREGEFVPPSGSKREDDFPLVFPPPGKCMYLRREPPKSELSRLLDFEESLPKVVPQVSYETRDEIFGPPIRSSTFRYPPPSNNPAPQIQGPVIHEPLNESQRFYHAQPIASRPSAQSTRGSDRGSLDRSRNVQSTSTASQLSHGVRKPGSGYHHARDRSHPYRRDEPGFSKTGGESPSKATSSIPCQSSQSPKRVVPPFQQTTASLGVFPPITQAKKALVPEATSSPAPMAAATTGRTTHADGAANDPGGHKGSSLNPPPFSSARSEASFATANPTVSVIKDDQDVVMIEESSVDREVLMTVESRKRSNAYLNGRLNRSLAPQTQCLDVVQVRFFASPDSELVCYPVRISNIHAPRVSKVQVIIDQMLGTDTDNPLEGVAISCGMQDADGTYCVEVGFIYAEDAMSALVEHGSEMMRPSPDKDEDHIWHVSPVTRIAAGTSCTVFPQSLGYISSRSNSTRKSVLQEALARERRVESVEPTMAYQSCIRRMESLFTAISAAEEAECNHQGTAVTPLRPFDSFTYSLNSLSDFVVDADDSALLEFQSQWPLPRRTVEQSTVEAADPVKVPLPPPTTQSNSRLKTTEKRKAKESAMVTLTEEQQMTSVEVAKARRLTWDRAKNLYEAWRSNDIPLPSIPVPENPRTHEPRPQDAMNRGQWKDLKNELNNATRALGRGHPGWSQRNVDALRKRVQEEEEIRKKLVTHHNAHNNAMRAATNNTFILIWDWYEACTSIIESVRVSMAVPAVARFRDLKPMKDEERAAYVQSLSLGALQREFSPPRRLLKLYGPRKKEIEELINSRQPRHEPSNEPGKSSNSDSNSLLIALHLKAASADSMDTT